MPGMATAELVMKCIASVREHSKLPAQHSCSSAVMEDLVIRKCITLCKALSDAAVTAVIKDFSVHLFKQTLFMQFKGHINTLYAWCPSGSWDDVIVNGILKCIS